MRLARQIRNRNDIQVEDEVVESGDAIEWDISQGVTRGTVVKRQTRETFINRHKVAASKEKPQFIVRSDKSGKAAAHKPEELRRNPDHGQPPSLAAFGHDVFGPVDQPAPQNRLAATAPADAKSCKAQPRCKRKRRAGADDDEHYVYAIAL